MREWLNKGLGEAKREYMEQVEERRKLGTIGKETLWEVYYR